MSTPDTFAEREFDVRDPLPSGVTVLEASAGTGKTYAIAALAARYVAGGVPLSEILIVTFTRMATTELRDRVRERVVATEQGLDNVLRGVPPDVDDEVVAQLAEGTREAVEARRENLARAIADFDAATINTTHQFCERVLDELGISGDVDRDRTFVEDPSDLIAEVVDDLYIRKFAPGGPILFDRKEALEIAHLAVNNPLAPIEPANAQSGSTPHTRARFAKAVREEFKTRKRRQRIFTYDDILVRLKEILEDDVRGPRAVQRLKDRYRVVLVDEFQDTDPIQWAIMKQAFGDGETTLVLIGDPKQAIYAFRGADVFAYLEACEEGTNATLRTNWRSDQQLIDAYDALFDNAQLGHKDIRFLKVKATEVNQSPRLTGAPISEPLRVRVVHDDEPDLELTYGGHHQSDSAREHVARDLAADVVGLLESGAEIEVRDNDGAVMRRDRVQPGHIAVLVRKNKAAAQVRDALERVGVPAVINGAGSVFDTLAAREWLRLLEAIERPTSPTRARAAAMTPFFGWTAEEISAASDAEWEDVHERLHRWARVLRLRGVASLTESIMLRGLAARVLRETAGERRLTDIRHIGHLLHSTASAEGLGVTALAAWLHRRIDEAERDTNDEERSRRLESDAEAVQVLTIHRSKGLEFPIVYFPYLWDPIFMSEKARPVFFHDSANGYERTIAVGLEDADHVRHSRTHEEEERGEDLRLAYVALTRAKHQAVVWWSSTKASRNSGLARLLFAREPDGWIQPSTRSRPTPDKVIAEFEKLAEENPGRISIERASYDEEACWVGEVRDGSALVAGRFDRQLDWGWRRTSYSDITRDAHDPRVASEPEEEAVVEDELESTVPRPPVGEPSSSGEGVPSLWANMPSGVHIGTFVHRVFEAVDFAAPDLDAELAARVAAAQARGGVDIGDTGEAIAAIRAVIETPLGPLLGDGGGGVRLRDLSRRDRLDELEFELPLAGGDDPTGQLTVDAIGDVLRAHLPASDPLAGYADRLRDPALRRDVRGYLTGSIDLVARVPDAGGVPRFAVVDYKTNWLGAVGEELTTWHHRPAALRAEMERAHYSLQALLYTAALHRYLRWRMPGYSPERNLAGVLYLFVRGMVGADTPTEGGSPHGVFAWSPPPALVEDLSNVLGTGGDL
jgi:exodeoxyribonuclease V beta subunit